MSEAEPRIDAVEAAEENTPRTATRHAGSLASTLTFAIVGIVGGLLAAGLLHATEGYIFVPWPEGVPEASGNAGMTAEQLEASTNRRIASDFRNTALGFCLAAAAVAGLLGVANGVARRSLPTMLKGGLVGIVSGAALGALGGYLAVLVRELISGWVSESPVAVQARTMAIQFPSWLGVAAASTLAVCALTAPGPRRMVPVFGAAIAGLLIALLLYPTAASIMFPGEATDVVVPTAQFAATSRFAWGAVTVGLMALLLGRQACSSDPAS